MAPEENGEDPGLLDQLVEWTARAMDAVGLNGRRLRWRWQARRKQMAESGAQREVLLRSAKGKHKMCPSCRALVERNAATCPDCGEPLGRVSKPGTGRLLANVLPGTTAVTSLILLANGFWFVMMLMVQIRSGSGGGLGIMSAFDPEVMVRFGSGLSRPAMLSDGTITGGEWWRVITPIFLHGGTLHFFMNTMFLFYLGPTVQEIFGTERYWVCYLACGISGSFLSQLRPVNTVGASGAIMGLIGLLLVYGLRHRSSLGQAMKAMIGRLVVFFVLLTLIAGRGMRIDHLNHIGGFACGALLALIVSDRPPRSKLEARTWTTLALAGVLLVLFAFYKVAMFQR